MRAPLADLRGANAIDAVADADYSVEVVELSVVLFACGDKG